MIGQHERENLAVVEADGFEHAQFPGAFARGLLWFGRFAWDDVRDTRRSAESRIAPLLSPSARLHASRRYENSIGRMSELITYRGLPPCLL